MFDTLKKYFGFDALRPMQEEIIRTVLEGLDAFVLMPTGGGKSLCYQLPALLLPGATLVISPLISLMKDQVDALAANGVPAACLNSTLESREQRLIEDATREGKIKLLYIAPERLSSPSCRRWLQTISVSLIAVDEAHCISEWGHDFRPDYRNVNLLRDSFPKAPVIALTATATEHVRKDIVRELRLEKARLFLASFNRPNLRYHVEPKQRAFPRLLSLLSERRNESVIIYCSSRKGTETLTRDLQHEGHAAAAYHAGLTGAERNKTQKNFVKDNIRIIVATIAFGMGIDKPDVRLVVHYDVPKTIEGYYQETGRAGRDGLPSDCVLLYAPGDVRKHRYFIDQMQDREEQMRSAEQLRQVGNYCDTLACRRQFLLRYFGETWNDDSCASCDNCLSPKPLVDATVMAQKILSAILKTGERFGARYIVQVLRGASGADIARNGHQHLSVYGIAKETSRESLQAIIRALVTRGLLIRTDGDYPTLRVSSAGRRWLQERQTLSLPAWETARPDSSGESKKDDRYDTELFETLRTLRKHIADRDRVPPFVVFGDASLRAMCQQFPQTLGEFARIPGVGQEKLRRYGDAFLRVISGYAATHAIVKIPKDRTIIRASSTYGETLGMLQQRMPIAEIAYRRSLTPGTILSHIEKIVEAKGAIDLDWLKPSGERFEKIAAAFLSSGQTALSPVRALLGDEYSWDELRLARLFLPPKPSPPASVRSA